MIEVPATDTAMVVVVVVVEVVDVSVVVVVVVERTVAGELHPASARASAAATTIAVARVSRCRIS